MSTRCSVIIRQNSKNIQFYHHSDGYPMGVGAELQNALARYTGAIDIDNIAEYVKGLDLQYELEKAFVCETDWVCHSDIEYLYLIVIEKKGIRLLCYEINEYLIDSRFVISELIKAEKSKIVIDEFFPIEPVKKSAKKAEPDCANLLAIATDELLIAELKRRGYAGTLTKSITL